MKRQVFIWLALGLFLAAALRDRFDAWIDATELPPLISVTSPELRDRHGRLLRAYTVDDGRWRLAVALADADPAFLKMLIAYEDKRFWRHRGVDWLAMMRAFGQAVWHGRIVSGGSTLTMQTARLIERGSTGKLSGKLRQIRVALALERQLSKPEILTLYLNRAPYGGNLEGLRAASFAWFGKEPRRLTPAESALLIALPQAPEYRRPDLHHATAVRARNRVLDRLVVAGTLPPEDANSAKTEPVPARRRPFPALAPHLSDRLVAENPAEGRLHLTIDGGLQRQLEELARLAIRGQDMHLSVAILVADHRNGEILASVGSAGYRADGRQGFVDMTRALRSPGSTLKPLIYAMAFDEGLVHPESLIDDSPTAFGRYVPQNFDGQFRGTIRVRRALQLSLNVPVVKLADALGPARIVARLRRADVQPVVPGGKPGLAVVLGGLGISLHDLVQLYASLASGGRLQRLHVVARTDTEHAENVGALISREAAWHVGNILSGLAPPPGAPHNSLVYKTGTSYGHRDAWAIGYDGQHVIGVWMGRPDGTPVPGVFGADLAAPVLFEAFQRLKPALSPLAPPPPTALIAGNAELPPPLRHFRPRNTLFTHAPGAPEISFPPDGAVVVAEGPVVVKVRDGKAPFTWLVNGEPRVIAGHERQEQLDLEVPGFAVLSVIDAEGRAARSSISLR